MVVDDLELGILPPASPAQTTACHQVQHFHVGSESLMFAGRTTPSTIFPQLLLVFPFETDWSLYHDSKTPSNQSTVDSMNLESGRSVCIPESCPPPSWASSCKGQKYNMNALEGERSLSVNGVLRFRDHRDPRMGQRPYI